MKKIIVILFLFIFTSCSTKVDGYSWNNLQTINQGGVEIEITRLAIYSKASLPKEEQNSLNESFDFHDTPTICDMYFKITNNREIVMSVYPAQGLLMANDEQVQLLFSSGDLDGFTGGEIFPGATVTGFARFGLKKVTPDSIEKMLIKISSPFGEDFSAYGDDYNFNLDLSQHQWIEKPDGLQ